MKNMLVIGMGRFGQRLAERLLELKNNVMIVDDNADRINILAPHFTNAQIADCTNPDVLNALGVDTFDICFVTIGEDFQSSLVITSLLKKHGARCIVAKASQDIQADLLHKIGADEVVYPEVEIAEKLAQVKARYEAVTPDFPLEGPVVLHAQELENLFRSIANNLNNASVYSHTNLFRKGDAIQKNRTGDPIGITMAGQAPGSVRSAKFDSDGLSLGSIRLVEDGKAVNYYGSNRFSQYLGEVPTGNLPCCLVDPGTAKTPEGSCLEVLSMSGLQVDFYNDYIGGEVRLAYYHTTGKVIPVTGISISGKLSQVLAGIRLSGDVTTFGGYYGPDTAILGDMQIF